MRLGLGALALRLGRGAWRCVWALVLWRCVSGLGALALRLGLGALALRLGLGALASGLGLGALEMRFSRGKCSRLRRLWGVVSRFLVGLLNPLLCKSPTGLAAFPAAPARRILQRQML